MIWIMFDERSGGNEVELSEDVYRSRAICLHEGQIGLTQRKVAFPPSGEMD